MLNVQNLELLQIVLSNFYTKLNTGMEPGSGAGAFVSLMQLCLLWNHCHLLEKRMTPVVLYAKHASF